MIEKLIFQRSSNKLLTILLLIFHIVLFEILTIQQKILSILKKTMKKQQQ